MLQACLNGGRSRDFHAAVPAIPDELAADAKAVIAAGADELHIHVRGHDGKESLHPDDVAQALATVRASVPGVPVGLSTAGGSRRRTRATGAYPRMDLPPTTSPSI